MALKYKIKQEQGMTLLEVLVAMTLMVVISAISFASLNGLIDAKNHTDKVAQNLRQELLTSQQLNNDFHAMIKRQVKDSFGAKKPAIIGSYTSIEFSRNGNSNPLNQKRSELQRVKWFVKDHQLMRATLNTIDVGTTAKWNIRTYMNDVDELNFYYVSSANQQSRTWPVQNNISPLRNIQFNLTLLGGTRLKYFMRPKL